jgi:hypothetical protein
MAGDGERPAADPGDADRRSYLSVLIDPKITGARRDALIAAARRGADLDEDWARYARLIEYDVPGRFWPLTVVRSLRGQRSPAGVQSWAVRCMKVDWAIRSRALHIVPGLSRVQGSQD